MEEQGDSAALPVLPGGSKDSSEPWRHDGHVKGLSVKASESGASLLKVLNEQSQGSRGMALELSLPLPSALTRR